MNDVTICPECGRRARVQWRAVFGSANGPIEHAKVRCSRGHVLLLPASTLAPPKCPADQDPAS